ncbi:MAG: alkaline phosphatase [Cytophagales bacterium]|nr:MAG: alkaline phosphatase [Cytophagales bacterium]
MRIFIFIFISFLFLSTACKNTEKTSNQPAEKPNKPAFSPYIQPSGIKRQWAQSATAYDVKKILPPANVSGKVKNIIFLIGDGMGLTQIYAAMTANKGKLNIENCTYTGLIKTYASDAYITDSAAGATAFACGTKTYNGAIGVDAQGNPVKTILEIAEEKGLATGMVATSSITHATPASFIAHQKSRKMEEEIAADFLNTDIDVFIGGGKQFFEHSVGDKNLLIDLKNKGYQVVDNLKDITAVTKGKLAGFTAEVQNPKMSEGRGDMLSQSTKTAINILKQNPNGFFLMVEGSQIDWGGHDNNPQYVIDEALDFDKVIGEVLEFAAKDGETLVVITADHETGGLTLLGGNISEGKVESAFSTGGHSAVMVPVYSFGVQADKFTGIYENTAIYDKMMSILGFKK